MKVRAFSLQLPATFIAVLAVPFLVNAGTRAAEADAFTARQIEQLVADGYYNDAKRRAADSLTAIEAAGLGRTEEAARVRDQWVEALLGGGESRDPATLPAAMQAVTIREKHSGANTVEVVRSLDRLARVQRAQIKYSDAAQSLARAFAILNELPNPSELDVAALLSTMGELLCYQQETEAALALLDVALNERERLLGPDHRLVADVVASRELCEPDPDIDTLVASMRHVVERMEAAYGPEHPRTGFVLVSLNTALSDRGDFDEARSSIDRAIRIFQERPGAVSTRSAYALDNLGATLLESGDYASAWIPMHRAYEIRLQIWGPENWLTATSINNLAMLYAQMGEYERAAAMFAQAVRVYELTFGEWSYDLAMALGDQGRALVDGGRAEEAVPPLERSVAIREHIFGAGSWRVAPPLKSLAQARIDAGRYAEAVELARRALQVQEAGLGSENYQLAETHRILAEALRGLGDRGAALEHATRAAKMLQASLGPTHPQLARLLATQARLQLEAGDSVAAVRNATRAESLAREHIRLVARASDDTAILAYAASRASGLDTLVTVATREGSAGSQATEQALDNVIRSRAMVLDQSMERWRAVRSDDQADVEPLIEAVRRAAERLSFLIVRGPSAGDDPHYPDRLRIARMELREGERALANRSAAFREFSAQEETGLQQVSHALPEDGALVSFVRYQDQLPGRRQGPTAGATKPVPSYAAFVLLRDSGEPVAIPLGEATIIDDAVTRWRRSLMRMTMASASGERAEERGYRRVAEDLRRLVWDPVVGRLGEARRVFLVPDADIDFVSFAALPIGTDQYLVDTGRRLHYLTAERDLYAPDEQRLADGLLAVGDPDFNDRRLYVALDPRPRVSGPDADAAPAPFRGSRPRCGAFTGMRFTPLPQTVQEVTDIARLWRSIPLVRGEANETQIKRMAPGHRVVHLATHGFFLGAACERAPDSSTSGLAADSGLPATLRDNPLLLSGLALAGANVREAAAANEDDGILTAEEIAHLDLRGTEWAVLSACDTGLGEVRTNEGVFGLRRAFQLAGADTVIMSMWPVEDRSTREWMTALYRRRLEDGDSTVDAVHGADVAVLNHRRALGESTHPFYWAGFIAAGDWR